MSLEDVQKKLREDLGKHLSESFDKILIEYMTDPEGAKEQSKARQEVYRKEYDKYHNVEVDEQGRRFIRHYLGDSTPANKFG